MVIKYIISAVNLQRARCMARDLNLNENEYLYVNSGESYYSGVRHKLYGMRVEHKSQLIGPFSEYEKNYLTRAAVKKETFDFSVALEFLKQGKKVKRAHWGGYWFIPDSVRFLENEKSNTVLDFNKMIVAKLKDYGGYAPAQPYQEDILANDWELVR